MNLLVNGETVEHSGEGDLLSLLTEVGANPKLCAVMVNGSVVPRETWADTALSENDEIEILVFASGG
ncbi:MAG: sulfur carrier protein ThiS [Lentisphaerae bacterium]|jgi:sulfur carrier protein|nr:sulfur carrier protein ThiS [Lentisphaerota bacterium]MBT4818601.1 sulfur carrier protein ThiS [Lentisphaerota bacterium]MBT5605701.1 sulfur carrier protein ThiS [Lentisphaerota bacterium]MBT7060509.1 sulfur carrier protein ThiS [Lentisphaerota bacterium]MBT7844416.1 sulfur carrier protein ThiS [Lentisphaerota bacterium]